MHIRTLVTIVFITLSAIGWSQTKNFIDQPFIETVAHVDTLVTPDKIYLNILLLERDTKGKVSVEELETRMESTLKALGIDTQEHLTLNDLESNFNTYFLKSQDVVKSKAYSLMLKDAQTAGLVIAELEAVEISNVKLDRTEYSKIEQVELELKSRAILKARHQAMAMTKPLNQLVGPAIHISDQAGIPASYANQNRLRGVQIKRMPGRGSKSFAPADIEFKKIKIESRVAVKFKLEQ